MNDTTTESTVISFEAGDAAGQTAWRTAFDKNDSYILRWFDLEGRCIRETFSSTIEDPSTHWYAKSWPCGVQMAAKIVWKFQDGTTVNIDNTKEYLRCICKNKK